VTLLLRALAASFLVLALDSVLLGRGAALELERGARLPTANPFAGQSLYVDPNSNARRQSERWRRSRAGDAAAIERIAVQPQADWFGDWNSDIRPAVAKRVRTIVARGALPVLVAYNIPKRDCGGYSSGGARSPRNYRRWVRRFADGLGGLRAVVILEPDALAGLDCLTRAERRTRVRLLAKAVTTLSSHSNVAVYLDAGHSRWQPVSVIAARLRAAGVRRARGFSLNVSNFRTTRAETAYGARVSARIGGNPFVIDTSRNGAGPAPGGEWCNPPGRALGHAPIVNTTRPLVDAYLWIKRPGESDGTCNGGPPAGRWWPQYALDLARRAR
jgi:endoglucanase